MLTDNPELGSFHPVALQVTLLTGPHEVENALVYLTAQDGANPPGLYLRGASSWSNIQGSVVSD